MTLRQETRVRARALQLLYAMEMNQGKRADAVANGLAHLTGEVRVVVDGAEPMVVELLSQVDRLDQLAAAAADNWRLDRIATIERNILRIGIFELLMGRVPPRVAIDEALWLTHRFAGAKAPPFVNGVLDRVARELGRL